MGNVFIANNKCLKLKGCDCARLAAMYYLLIISQGSYAYEGTCTPEKKAQI